MSVKNIVVATDSDSVFEDIDAALASGDLDVLRVRAGSDVLPVVQAKNPDMVILDMQIGNMGGIAACLAIRQEEGAARLEERPVALLLDRSADVFIAQESDADGWLIKPLDSLRLSRMAKALLANDTHFEGVTGETSLTPETTSPTSD